jgi:hypothetical protein
VTRDKKESVPLRGYLIIGLMMELIMALSIKSVFHFVNCKANVVQVWEVELKKWETNISALAKCRTHSAVNPGDLQDDDEDPVIGRSTKGRHCPYEGCGRTEPFAKRKELQYSRQRTFSPVPMSQTRF